MKNKLITGSNNRYFSITGYTESTNLISELQAIDIAESVVEGIVVEMELGENEGKYVYGIELKTNNGKTDIEVDARTGSILKKGIEYK